ncbi:MAG: Holliday junction resolvase RuvX [Eubacteriales bacterium]|nr:Holliday junction resolvase RuvX [Eubacteriales bacterium]MDD3213809.1 Holliday junction resolvase RuvX [Eubacteriales bacterium]
MTGSGRVLALDVGDVRIGVAVTDPTRTIAQPVEVYRRVGYGPDSRYVQALCERYQTADVLLGLPLNMDGTRGGQAEKALAFGKVLADAGLNIFYWDERMTTVTAEKTLIEGGVRRDERKRNVDKLAAAVILTQWLASGAKILNDTET